MNQTKTHLSFIDEHAKNFLFACFDYRKKKKPRIYYGSLNTKKPLLEKANEEDYCIYVTVNEVDGTRNEKNIYQRKKENITRCRAIWVEDDETRDLPRDDFPLPPSLIIESSKHKYHYYWLTSTTEFDQWESVMKNMVANWGCDPNARDIARVLRLAGFKHNKDLKNPFETRIIQSEGTEYEWTTIVGAFGEFVEEEGGKSEGSESLGDYDESKAVQLILESKNYHNSLTSISMSLANKGLSRDIIKFTLKGLMYAVPEGSRRTEWADRISDEHLYECIDSALKKVAEEKDDDFVDPDELKDFEDSLPEGSDIEYPPSIMGDLCREIFEMAPHPNKIISIAAGIGLVAGIVGRRYNVSGMGLNLYITILADSGIGKANLKDSINRALRGNGGPFNAGAAFIGASRFTGPKAVFDMLNNGLSRICVMEEAGLLSESKSGDQQGISRATLDLYTSSGLGKFAGNEAYSDAKNSVPVLHSPALSIISISTPKSFLRSMKSKSAELSGELARMWIMRSVEDKTYFNKNMRKDFSKETKESLKELIKLANVVQKPEAELKVVNVNISDKYYEDSKHWVDEENRYKKEGDHLRRTLCSRAWAKIIKMAAVISVFNGKIEIGDEEYEWAKKAVNQELEFIQRTFTHESTDELHTVVMGVVYQPIVKCLKGKYSDPKKCSSPEMRKQGIFTYTNISQILKNNAVLRDLDDDTSRNNPKTGLEKCLSYMIRSGLLVKLEAAELRSHGCRAKSGYKITDEFKLLGDL